MTIAHQIVITFTKDDDEFHDNPKYMTGVIIMPSLVAMTNRDMVMMIAKIAMVCYCLYYQYYYEHYYQYYCYYYDCNDHYAYYKAAYSDG